MTGCAEEARKNPRGGPSGTGFALRGATPRASISAIRRRDSLVKLLADNRVVCSRTVPGVGLTPPQRVPTSPVDADLRAELVDWAARWRCHLVDGSESKTRKVVAGSGFETDHGP